jgi:nicotinate-nucleotide pyrophosphorylase (carboxylating)
VKELNTYYEAAGLDYDETRALVALALAEDLRYGPDVTSEAAIPQGARGEGAIVSRQSGVVCGSLVALEVLSQCGVALGEVEVVAVDGSGVGPGDTVLRAAGPLHQLLLAERTMLNFMTHLSGVATATKAWVDAVAGTKCQIRDTRKTTPGLRSLEKYAVRCGGGVNHRMGLGDAALIKDNHVIATGSIAAAVKAVRDMFPDVALEAECDVLDQVVEAAVAGAKLILLDNMSDDEIRIVLNVRGAFPTEFSGVRFEVSGGLWLERAPHLAALGVDYLAVGALTHSSPVLDLGFDLT